MQSTLTAHDVISEWAEKMPDREFLLQPVDGQLRVTTFAEAIDQAQRTATALQELGLKPNDRVAILAKNSAEWVVVDLAIAMAGLISVPIYPTANADTVSYVLGHSEAKAIFIGKLDDPDSISGAIPTTLPSISLGYDSIVCQYAWRQLVDNAEPIATMHVPDKKDVMTILYTSGSTGKPKGVVLSYEAYHYGCNANNENLNFGADDRAVSYLPLAHITERACVVGPSLYAGCRIYFTESIETFSHDIRTARPTAFASVPRLWVKFQSGILAKMPSRKLRVMLAIPILGKAVARKIRVSLGLDECRLIASGSAPISPHTLLWYEKLGIDIGEGWGMSETSGLACGNFPFESRRIGTIGIPPEGTELKIAENGELLIRSPGLFTEYLKQPELTQESFTEDGFFHTGDKAEWDEKVEAFKITGRVKDIFKSAKGKYVAPLKIESRLSSNPLLEQICVIGSGLPAPIAIVVLAEAAQGLPRENVTNSLEATRTQTNAQLESHERLSNIYVANTEWTTENDLLTPTLKVKRDQIEARYQAAVESGLDTSVVWE